MFEENKSSVMIIRAQKNSIQEKKTDILIYTYKDIRLVVSMLFPY